MFCSKCGQQMPDGSSFCPSCGQRVAVYPMPSNNNNATYPPQGNFANSYNNYGYNNITFTTGTLVWLWICFIINAFIIFKNAPVIFNDVLPSLQYSNKIFPEITSISILVGGLLCFMYCAFTFSYLMLIIKKEHKFLKYMSNSVIFNVILLTIVFIICIPKSESSPSSYDRYNFIISAIETSVAIFAQSLGIFILMYILNPFSGVLNILITNAVMKKYWSNNFSSQTFVNNAPPSPQTKATDERWLCPHCNEMNPSSSLICRECGKVRKSADKWTCSHCNTPNPNSSLFCKGCGKIKE